MTRAYLQEIQEALAAYTWVQSVKVLRCEFEETDLEDILVYRFRVTLQDGGLLEFMERVVYLKQEERLQVTTYKYYWQDQNQQLVKRWDNAPHFPGLHGFPHHIHIGQKGNVVPNKPMMALELLAIVDQELL